MAVAPGAREIREALRNVREVRTCPLDFEMRSTPDGTGGTNLVFTGYACVTSVDDSAAYEMADSYGPFTEVVSPGAFRKTLGENADVQFLVNHEGLAMARTKSGTLKLSESLFGQTTGLYSEAYLDPKREDVKALQSAIERGDIDEMSMSFQCTRQVWDKDYTHRRINEVSLNHGDVSAVNYGANPHTGGTVGMRGRNQTAGSALLVPGRRSIAAMKADLLMLTNNRTPPRRSSPQRRDAVAEAKAFLAAERKRG
jgi:HK97 family phage prohead protease